MTELANYIYSTYSTILSLSQDDILRVGFSTDGTLIPSFDQDLLISLCTEARALFEKEENVLEINSDVVVVGDIHGNLHDLLRILNCIEMDKFSVVFLGDYVDRGNFSLECVTLLFSLKLLYPNKYFLLRGNHEFDSMCSQYGFRREILTYHNPKGTSKSRSLPKFATLSIDQTNPDVQAKDREIMKEIIAKEASDSYYDEHSYLHCYKYSEKLYKAFISAFSYLPIAAILNNTSICIHGGISPHLHKISSIQTHIQRPIDNFDDNKLLCDLLWGDPSHKTTDISQLFQENPRGRGKLFSGIAVADFLKSNNLRHLIRGHECVNHGTENMFNSKCITVFSASSYNQDSGNSSGILKVFKNDDIFKPVTFPPLQHLKKIDAKYFKVQSYFENVITKPIFSISSSITPMTSSEAMAPLTQTKSDIIFPNSNKNILCTEKVSGNNSYGDIACAGNGISLKPLNVNIGSQAMNRKSKMFPKTGRMNTGHAFNTGIKQKTQNTGNILNPIPKSLAYPKRHMSFQWANPNEIIVNDKNNIADDVIQPNKSDLILPKLVQKEEA